MAEELSYSIHLGSDKNRKNSAKKVAETNISGTTSYTNNGIQTAGTLSKVNNHNLREYDNNKAMIEILYGSDNLYQDVQNLYLEEFEEARLEYNAKQTRNDRKIDDYFKHISESELWDLACEFIIELGDKDFWEDKDLDYRKKMADVFREQIQDFMNYMPEFKFASAVAHFEEQSKSPHLHIVGVPVDNNCKRGMKKQVAKSKIFTKESLTKLQDKMRECCINSYNKVYSKNAVLKKKQKGRNRDINVKNMNDYQSLKSQYDKYNKRLAKTEEKTNKVDTTSKEVNNILESLKPTAFNKNNMVISKEDVEKIKDYTKSVTDTTKSIKKVSDLNIIIEDFEDSYRKLDKENRSLKYEVESKDDEISKLKNELSAKDKVIGKLRTELDKVKNEFSKLKDFWHRLMKHFQNKIGFDKDEHYKIVSDDLYKNGIFTNDEFEIATNIARKVQLPKEDTDKWKITKKNDMNLN